MNATHLIENWIFHFFFYILFLQLFLMNDPISFSHKRRNYVINLGENRVKIALNVKISKKNKKTKTKVHHLQTSQQYDRPLET